jgi:hypothetical protein
MPSPPPPGKKPGLGVGAIVAIVLGALLLLGGIAAGVYFLFIKDDKVTPPTARPTTVGTTRSTVAPTIAPSESDPEPEGELSEFEQRLSALDAYRAQHLGANPVYYYQNPTLDFAIDLRLDPEAARMMYVEPTPTGFWVTHRQSINYGLASLVDFPDDRTEDWTWNAVRIDVVTAEERDEIIAENEALVLEGVYAAAEFAKYKDGYLWIRETFPDKPDSARLAQELYGESVYFDRFYLKDHLAKSPGPEYAFEEPIVNAGDQWKDAVLLLTENPAEFEWQFCLPPYAQELNTTAHPNWEMLDYLITEPLYEYTSIDFDGDGIPEHVVHCSCDSLGVANFNGYWAVYAETLGGLKLVNFVNDGGSDLIYSDDAFYYLTAAGKMGDFVFAVEEMFIPLPAPEDRSQGYIQFSLLDMMISAYGGDLSDYTHQTIVPRLYISQWESDLSYFMVDAQEYWEAMDILEELLVGGIILPARNTYDVETGPRTLDMQPPDVLEDLADYLDSQFPLFPFAEHCWKNAITVEAAMADGTPVTIEKVESMLPYPELVGK